MVETIEGVIYYTVTEFATVLKVSQSTVERWIAKEKLRYWQLDTSSPIRIPSTELIRHLHPKADPQ